jgi:hypothetical protein
MRVGHTCGSAQLMAPPVKGRPLSFRGPFKGSGPGAFMLSREGAATKKKPRRSGASRHVLRSSAPAIGYRSALILGHLPECSLYRNDHFTEKMTAPMARQRDRWAATARSERARRSISAPPERRSQVAAKPRSVR